MSEKKDFWYSFNQIRSYNALFNFIILSRGLGKTYGFKKFAISEAIEGRGTFLYLRRTDVELQDSMDTFLKDVGKEFPQYTFRIRKNVLEYTIEDPDAEGEYLQPWEEIGYFAYLSNARRKKSVSYETVKYIAYDEFLIPPNEPRASYLPDEAMVFLDFYETVARMRDVQVFFLSNAMSTVNPYFLHFGLLLPKNKKGIKRLGEDIVIEYHDNEDYRKAKEQTRFGRMVADTRFGDYAFGNEFINEDSDFIMKKTPHSIYQFNLTIEGKTYAVYCDTREQKIFISNNVDRNFFLEYRFKEAGKGGLVFKSRRSNRRIDDLVTNFEYGNVYFENQTIKQEMIRFFERIM